MRIARGRYALPGAAEDRQKANELSATLCLDSAARYFGWKVKHQPAGPALAVRRKRHLTAEQRKGVRIVYVDLADEDLSSDGWATSHIRTVMDCASRLPFDEALAVADSAIRAGDVTPSELVAAAGKMPDRYRTRCSRVAACADGRAANPFESVLCAIAEDVPGLCIEPQVSIEQIGRCDLADEKLRLAVEAESFEFHGQRWHLKHDCERYNAFVIAGWVVCGSPGSTSCSNPSTCARSSAESSSG